MKDVVVKKEELVQIIKTNRENHRQIFEEAIDGYKAEAVRRLEENIEDIKKGKNFYININMPVPQDHTEDYNRVLKMLEMCINDTIVLDEQRFAQYVMDDWGWKEAFLNTSNMYNKKV